MNKQDTEKKLIGWTVILHHSDSEECRTYYTVAQVDSFHRHVTQYMESGKKFSVEPEWVSINE